MIGSNLVEAFGKNSDILKNGFEKALADLETQTEITGITGDMIFALDGNDEDGYSILGSEGLVTEAIDNIRGTGQVKIGGILWTARSENGSPIEEGALVTVDRVEGVKVLVSVRNDSLS